MIETTLTITNQSEKKSKDSLEGGGCIIHIIQVNDRDSQAKLDNTKYEISKYPFIINIDPRSHLELLDKKHRYSKNLKIYYNHWLKVKSNSNFFDWLDETNDTIELAECLRYSLNKETVYYCDDDVERRKYLVNILTVNGERLLCDQSNTPINTGKEGWIFVTRDDKIYCSPKITKSTPRFHHSSFFAGEYVEAAGLMEVVDGRLAVLYLHSGHYRPSEPHLFRFLQLVTSHHRLDLQLALVDAQRVLHSARGVTSDGSKARKVDAPLMVGLLDLMHFLCVKKKAWEGGLFTDVMCAVQRKSHLPPLSPLAPPQAGTVGDSLQSELELAVLLLGKPPVMRVATCDLKVETFASLALQRPDPRGVGLGGGDSEWWESAIDLYHGSTQYPISACKRDEVFRCDESISQPSHAKPPSDI